MEFRALIRVTGLVLIASFAMSLFAQQAPQGEATVRVAAANNQFALELFRSVSSNANATGKNIFLSPFSVSTALAMTYAGSRGKTQSQMATVLHFTLPPEQLHAGFADLLARTNPQSKHYQLNTANALWGQQGYRFEPDFLSVVTKSYGGGLQNVDFKERRPQAVRKINEWVENRTNQKIKNLVHQDDVSALTRLVLTNAIYFKGDWDSKFSKDATRPGPFKLASGNLVNVPMMNLSASFPFAESQTDGLKTIELPYAGGDLAMLVLLPAEGMEKLEASLTLVKLKELRATLRPQKVEVSLPKFKFETRYQLGSLLSAMGMPDAFSEERADFSGMTGAKTLHISRVIHQAMIDVNEEGSEAAAATAVVMQGKSIAAHRPVFHADHPFLFLIIHMPTESILFVGRVADPQGS